VYAGYTPAKTRRPLRRKTEPSSQGTFTGVRKYVLQTFATTPWLACRSFGTGRGVGYTPMQTATKQLWASALAAVVGSLCCVAPLVLLMLGISGAWIGQLTALEPYRPIFIGVTAIFMGLAFRQLYLVPTRCS
jgi:hypothetical protein